MGPGLYENNSEETDILLGDKFNKAIFGWLVQ